MNTQYQLTGCAAEAFKAGRMNLHCIPAPAGAELPAIAGNQVEFVAMAPYGKIVPLGFAVIREVVRARLEAISDDDIHASGYPNWTLFSADWTALYGAKGFSWDADPDAWMIRFEVLR